MIVVEQRDGTGAEPAHFVIDSAPKVDIGAEAGDSRYELSNVGGALRLDHDGFIVVNSGTSEIRFYDSLGQYERTAGRAGDGPGEFRGAGRVFRVDGSIAVFDHQLRRVTSLSRTGSIGAVVPVTAALPTGGIEPVGRLSDGSWIGVSPVLPVQPSPRIQRDTVIVVQLARGLDSVQRVIGRFPGAEDFIPVPAAGQPARSYGVPFGSDTYVLTHNDLVYVGDAAAAEVRIYRPDGQLSRVIRGVGHRRPVEASDIARAKEREIGQVGSRATAAIERRWAIVPIPTHHPAFTDIAVDASNRLWAFGATGPDGDIAMVFDEDGRYMATMRLPLGLSVAEIGTEHILGVEADSDNAEHVKLYGYRRE